jgi:hypothetical protein
MAVDSLWRGPQSEDGRSSWSQLPSRIWSHSTLKVSMSVFSMGHPPAIRIALCSPSTMHKIFARYWCSITTATVPVMMMVQPLKSPRLKTKKMMMK